MFRPPIDRLLMDTEAIRHLPLVLQNHDPDGARDVPVDATEKRPQNFFRAADSRVGDDEQYFLAQIIGPAEFSRRPGLRNQEWKLNKFQLMKIFEPLKDSEKFPTKPSDHMLDFLNCVKSRETPVCGVEIGAGSVIVCHIGNIAMLLGRKLTWDPAQERFVGDADANAMLTRKYRPPFIVPERV